MQSQQAAVRAGQRRRTTFASADELDDLLGLAISTNSGRAVQQPAMAPIVVQAAPVPASMPTSLNELFDCYRNFQEKIVALAVDLRKIEAHLFGEHWDTVINTPETKAPVDIAYLAMENLIKQAEKMYAPPGGALAIDRAEVWRALGNDERRHWRGVDRDASVPFDLARLHAHLADSYAGDAGETAAYRQQAAELIKFFRFEDSEAVATTKRHVACSVRVFSQHKDYAPKGTLEVSYNEHQRLSKAFKALSCAMAWAELPDLQASLSCAAVTGYCFAFKSRHRESFPGISIVLFKDKWTFEIDHKVAEQLRLFLGQYGA
jgi:hypothetical protein